MSITVSNCDEICNSPTNSSKAKMLYTFSKGERFSRRKIIMYALPNQGVIGSTIRPKIPQAGPPRSASAISTTSLKSKQFSNLVSPNPHPPTFITSSLILMKTRKKGSGLAAADSKWRSLGLSLGL